jgi:uncharacterized protein (DUF362 family)
MPPEHLVVVAQSSSAAYHDLDRPLEAPELPGGQARTCAHAAVRELLRLWQLDVNRFGTKQWNPVGDLIPAGARVVLKPNWVLHYNQSGTSLDCLITHPSVIEAVASYCALNKPASITIGDAPVQGCNFEVLSESCDLPGLSSRIQKQFGVPCTIADFRRTVLNGPALGDSRVENRRALSDYVLFDLAYESLLELPEWDSSRFRVTMYNPDLLNRTHARGRHQYLVTRDVIEADVVVNLPKLKSHRKAGITGALKNLVGINGNKEYLPHHRKGGSTTGGDCYEGHSWLKLQAENLYDVANRRSSGAMQAVAVRAAEKLTSVAARLGTDPDVEGAWYGNDTVWRMCLDLQRVLRYGRADGSLADAPQRTVLTITDAIVGGEGEGPLANTPHPTGFVTGSLSAPAAEWVHAYLMGFDPVKIPLVRESFGSFSYPLVHFPPSSIQVNVTGTCVPASELRPFGRPFEPPRGWRGHCELA